MFVKSTRFKQVWQLLLSLIVVNQITTRKMRTLINTVTRLRSIVLCWYNCAFHQHQTLKLLT